MATATKTPREQLEALIPQMQALADEIDEKGQEVPAETVKKLADMTEDASGLMTTITATAKAGNVGEAATALLSQFGEPGSTNTDPNAALAASTGIVDPKGMTLGEAFIKSVAFEEFRKKYVGADGLVRNGRIGDAATVPIGAPLWTPRGSKGLFNLDADTKALVTGLSDTSAGAFVTTQRLPQVPDLIPERRLTVRDLCTNITIASDTFDYVQVTGKTNAAAPTLEATTSATPGLNNVPVGAYTAAHGVKPESAVTFAVVSSIVETIAHMIPVTRRAAADGGQVRQLIDAFLMYGLREEEEDQILNGNGTTPNLRGILQTVGINTVGSAGTDLDAIVDGISAIRTDGYEATGLVIHPNDWFSTGFLLAKDSAGNYLLANPSAPIDQQQVLWGLRVVVTPAMTENTALVGAFRMAVVADRQQGTIYVSDSHNDWFARNILAILAEERLGFGVLDPEAFCTVTAL
jgi:HK97 family phage major capsid protein